MFFGLWFGIRDHGKGHTHTAHAVQKGWETRVDGFPALDHDGGLRPQAHDKKAHSHAMIEMGGDGGPAANGVLPING